ncbi:MAG: DUF3187 family protein [Gammaproteobacteria bacterium]|nr:DUF3187 family protein [Gammaproteobacteria bacterium]
MQKTTTTSVGSMLRALLMLGPGMAFAAAALAGNDDFPRPLSIGNQSPVMGVFGIPRAQGTAVPGAGVTRWEASLDLTSHFQGSETSDRSILFDGETARLAIQWRYGIDDKWSAGVELPWVHHGPGFLDQFIIDWHDLWGFPQDGRGNTANHRIRYRYERGGETLLDIDSSTGGVGDIVLSAQRRLWRGENNAGVLHAQLKLPTGDPDNLTGSGAADAAVGVEMSRQWRAGWHSMFRAGAGHLGEGDVLPGLQRAWAAYGGLDVVWRPIRALSFRVQYDAHTSPYGNSGLRELDGWSGLLTTGGTWHVNDRFALDLAVVENVPNASPVPDVSFHLRLRTTGAGGR